MHSCLLLGATGLTGNTLLNQLLNHPNIKQVTALVRQKAIPCEEENKNKLKIVQVDFEKLQDYSNFFVNHKFAFCALGTTRAAAGSAQRFVEIDQGYVIKAAEIYKQQNPDYSHFLYISSAGSSSSGSSLFLYPRTKAQTERMLSEILFTNLSIFKPAYLDGSKVGGRKNARVLERVFGDYIAPVVDKILPQKAMIDVRLLAKAMIIAALRPLTNQNSTDIKGNLKTNIEIVSNSEAIEISKK